MRVNYCGGTQQEKMIENGWRLICREDHETPEELYARLTKRGYMVKVYWTRTRVKGIRNYFAFVK